MPVLVSRRDGPPIFFFLDAERRSGGDRRRVGLRLVCERHGWQGDFDG